MTADGGVGLAAWDRLLDFHVREGTDGIVVAGTTGESPVLSADGNRGADPPGGRALPRQAQGHRRRGHQLDRPAPWRGPARCPGSAWMQ